MNEIVVGVKRVKEARLADPGEEANGALGAVWVTVDGREFPVDGAKSLIAVSLDSSADPLTFRASATKDKGGTNVHEGGFITVAMTVLCSSFRTVDFRDPEFAPERFRA
jgi:hypothetical protein